MKIPGPLTGTAPLVHWLNRLRDCVISQRVTSVVGGKVVEDSSGTMLCVERNTLNDPEEKKKHPFQIYVFPATERASPGSTDWRKFRVRGGYVIGKGTEPVEVSGTDGAKLDDDPIAEGDVTDITVDAEVERYWFWLDIDEGSDTVLLDHGETPPTNWTLLLIPIGWVDTNTKVADSEAIIRQFLRADAIIPCLDLVLEEE